VPGIINQHNPEIAVNAPFIRVIHLRNSAGSLFINDVDDNVYNNRTQYQVQSYIPFGKTIDILMTDRVLTSYHQGGIRNLKNRGLIAAFILRNRDVVQADIGFVYKVTPTEDLVLADTSAGAAFITLPSAEDVPEGFTIQIKKTSVDANQLQITSPDGQIDDNGSLYVLAGSQEAVSLEIDENGDWWVLTKSNAVSGGGGGTSSTNHEKSLHVGVVTGLSATAEVTREAKASLRVRTTSTGALSDAAFTGTVIVGLVKECDADLTVNAGITASAEVTHQASSTLSVRSTAAGALSRRVSERRDYYLTGAIAVPKGAGILYLNEDNVTTSSVPLVVNRRSRLVGGSIRVDVVDPVQTYDLEILLNGTVVESLRLPVSTLKVSSFGFSTPVAPDDEIQVRLSRVAGSNKSQFVHSRVSLELEEL